MFSQVRLSVRPATPADRAAILALTRHEARTHRHLDWRPPEAWIGHGPFLVAESGRRVVGCLACTPDPPDTAWIRLFAVAFGHSPQRVWGDLWPAALDGLRARAVTSVAVLELDPWIAPLVRAAGFEQTHAVVVLVRERGAHLPARRGPVRIREMDAGDLNAVVEVDRAAFQPPWQHSFHSLRFAFEQAEVATVAERDGQIVGHQISTLTRLGGHLARLAVRPEVQGQGIGRALTISALEHFERQRRSLVSVNTQDNNAVSLRLYRSLGFHPTGEEFPVLQLDPGAAPRA